VTKPIKPTLKPIPPGSIAEHLGNSLIAASGWITDADAGVVCLARRLAVLIDSILDSGTDLDKLASLANKLESLIKELKLTPLSRDKSQGTVEEVDSSGKYADQYLRLVKPENSKPKAKRANTRASSSRLSE
jgi:hypothetical protein